MRMVMLALLGMAGLAPLRAASAANVGKAADVAAVAGAIRADGSQGDKILQIVVVGAYAVAEVQREDETVISTEAYTQRGNKLRPQQPGWHLAGLIAGVPAACWLEEYGYPQDVAQEIAGDIPAMERVTQSNPRYQCG